MMSSSVLLLRKVLDRQLLRVELRCHKNKNNNSNTIIGSNGVARYLDGTVTRSVGGRSCCNRHLFVGIQSSSSSSRHVRVFSTQKNVVIRQTTTVTAVSSTDLEKDNSPAVVASTTTATASSPRSATKTGKQEGSPTTTTTKAYLDLAKAKLSGLVVATTAAGFIAAGGPISSQLHVLGSVVVGTALCSSSAAAWNQIAERERDSRMKRTQQRPLVAGTLTLAQATTAATVWGLAGTSLLAVGTDPVTTALGASNIALYAGLYTYMKPHSIYNTWVGAVVGAVPPIMGWTAATGGSLFDMEALLLGGTLYLWQMPHFFALSYMHRVDYARGGFAMVPCLEQDGEKTAALVVRYAWYLSAIPFLATATQVTSSMFAFEGIALNAYALTVAHKFQRERTNANARKVFLTSLWYLPCLLMCFLIHSKTWDEEKDTDDAIAKFLADQIHHVRERGRHLCVHETAVHKLPKNTSTGEDASACPITVGAKRGGRGVQEASAVLQETADTVTSSLQAKNTSTRAPGAVVPE